RTTLHTQIMSGDVMKMRKVESIAVPPGKSVVLAPGGLHIMLTGLTRPLKAGERFPLSLTFEAAGRIAVEVVVRPIGAMGAGQPKKGGMHHR
ncbi:MAG: copper chaperone PCu(A)C, partial [Alphaproteobacteria bacterium]